MISIIVPLYNKQEAIERCIQSVIQQTYQNWELILIDDGSTDSSAIKVKHFLKDSRIRYIYKKNGGVSSARNKGIDLAEGEWSIYLDADDYFMPNALYILLHTANKYKLNICSGNFWIEKKNQKINYCYGKERIVKNNFRAWYFRTCYLRTGNTLFKTSLLKQHKFDENLIRYEDAKWAFNIMRENKVIYTPNYVLSYSQDQLGLSKPSQDITKDFIFSLDFSNKTFWERIILANLVNQGLQIYPDKKKKLYEKYSTSKLFIQMEHICSYFFRVFFKLRDVLNTYIHKHSKT